MYYEVTIEDVVRLDPARFNEPIKEAVLKILKNTYEGKIDKDLGLIVAITEIEEIEDGLLVPDDPGSFHKTKFKMICFKPELHEIIRGYITNITEYGAVVRFGPMDGFMHISQIADDFISYNGKTQSLTGKQKKINLQAGDVVIAKIIAVSLKNNVAESKINLTMRQPGLGKIEWLKEVEKK
ncbi:MAG: DNA-directed RNA polymerase [archaeon]